MFFILTFERLDEINGCMIRSATKRVGPFNSIKEAIAYGHKWADKDECYYPCAVDSPEIVSKAISSTQDAALANC